jgi:hypothetical protein
MGTGVGCHSTPMFMVSTWDARAGWPADLRRNPYSLVSSRFCSLCRGQSKDGRPEQKIHVEGRKSIAEPDNGKG